MSFYWNFREKLIEYNSKIKNKALWIKRKKLKKERKRKDNERID